MRCAPVVARDFGITMPPIYGVGGILVVFSLKFYPFVYLMVSGALANINRSLEEAAEGLGLTPVQRVFKISFPMVFPALSAGGLLALIQSIADFGTPRLLGRGFNVLAMEAYTLYSAEVGYREVDQRRHAGDDALCLPDTSKRCHSSSNCSIADRQELIIVNKDRHFELYPLPLVTNHNRRAFSNSRSVGPANVLREVKRCASIESHSNQHNFCVYVKKHTRRRCRSQGIAQLVTGSDFVCVSAPS